MKRDAKNRLVNDDVEIPSIMFQNTIISELRESAILVDYDPIEVINDPEILTKLFIKYSGAGENEKIQSLMMELLHLNPPITRFESKEDLEIDARRRMKKKIIPTICKMSSEVTLWLKKQDIELQLELAKKVFLIQKYGFYGHPEKDCKDLSHGLVQVFLSHDLRLYVSKLSEDNKYVAALLLVGRKHNQAKDVAFILKHLRF